MKMKRLLASAMSAVCVLGTGALPAANVLTTNAADPWLDVTLEADMMYAKPGDTVKVNVNVGNVYAHPITAGGMQFKLNSSLELVSITGSDGNAINANTETGEIAFAYGVDGKSMPGTPTLVAVYTYKIPDTAANGDCFTVSGDWGFSYACDADGNDLRLELAFANSMITVKDDNAPADKKNVWLKALPAQLEVAPGDEFKVNIAASGLDVGDVSGFQCKLNMPEGIECLGIEKATTNSGVELKFNPETLELASAQQKGDAFGFTGGENIATIKFKVPESFAPGSYEYYLSDAAVTDSKGDIIDPILGSTNPLTVIGVKITGKLGDANLDGAVDAKDASKVLVEYSLLSTGKPETFNEQQKLNGDVNFDGKIDSKDASRILAYYSYLSTGGEMIMEDWVKEN